MIPEQSQLIKILREILCDKCFFASKEEYSRSGYSLELEPETAYRDIDYRNAELFDTPEKALDAYINKHYSKP